jgi:hypothetical protein
VKVALSISIMDSAACPAITDANKQNLMTAGHLQPWGLPTALKTESNMKRNIYRSSER